MSTRTPHIVGGGLRTVAKAAYEAKQREAQASKRIQFVTERNAALGRQRDAANQRLSVLRADVARISAAIASDTLTNPERTLAVLERHAAKEAALVADIARLTAKMGG